MDDPIQEQSCRCYFLSDERIVGYEGVFSQDDDHAIEKARELLRAVTHTALELWRSTDCVRTHPPSRLRGEIRPRRQKCNRHPTTPASSAKSQADLV